MAPQLVRSESQKSPVKPRLAQAARIAPCRLVTPVREPPAGDRPHQLVQGRSLDTRRAGYSANPCYPRILPRPKYPRTKSTMRTITTMMTMVSKLMGCTTCCWDSAKVSGRRVVPSRDGRQGAQAPIQSRLLT